MVLCVFFVLLKVCWVKHVSIQGTTHHHVCRQHLGTIFVFACAQHKSVRLEAGVLYTVLKVKTTAALDDSYWLLYNIHIPCPQRSGSGTYLLTLITLPL